MEKREGCEWGLKIGWKNNAFVRHLPQRPTPQSQQFRPNTITRSYWNYTWYRLLWCHRSWWSNTTSLCTYMCVCVRECVCMNKIETCLNISRNSQEIGRAHKTGNLFRDNSAKHLIYTTTPFINEISFNEFYNEINCKRQRRGLCEDVHTCLQAYLHTCVLCVCVRACLSMQASMCICMCVCQSPPLTHSQRESSVWLILIHLIRKQSVFPREYQCGEETEGPGCDWLELSDGFITMLSEMSLRRVWTGDRLAHNGQLSLSKSCSPFIHSVKSCLSINNTCEQYSHLTYIFIYNHFHRWHRPS